MRLSSLSTFSAFFAFFALDLFLTSSLTWSSNAVSLFCLFLPAFSVAPSPPFGLGFNFDFLSLLPPSLPPGLSSA
eukprot:CAMPEP_0196643580 /NCGR_PEP_ID=MMETSP1085-20130531/6008_1 /TAXON_ID=41879 ORGANISM="Pycnococcus sp, Strain CCMP1998" /NCGR_SAMPLE_ID=MMETSP1085 /ASSEMBLY_ACC=CAM_ASM_000807 /LENGTH=74 /DNA_ID=CAMNT_0041973065 /DNA_START=20 /DNA_END=240 /DNA_ORIENTATION=-